MNQLIAWLSDFHQDDAGASAAEYALILALIGAGIAAASLALGNAITISMNTTASCIAAPDAC